MKFLFLSCLVSSVAIYEEKARFSITYPSRSLFPSCFLFSGNLLLLKEGNSVIQLKLWEFFLLIYFSIVFKNFSVSILLCVIIGMCMRACTRTHAHARTFLPTCIQWIRYSTILLGAGSLLDYDFPMSSESIPCSTV